jgi:GH15 family glucan-1,4-alpha-glucosidase
MQGVDASLLGVALPYRMLESGDPLFQGTVARIEADLHRPQGGVYRYLGDTYYGGGEWLLLAAWLGWYHAERGDRARAADLLDWVEAQADPDGNLPEQVSEHLLSPPHYAEWVGRWGPVAKPLLWSHAMHLILVEAMRSG